MRFMTTHLGASVALSGHRARALASNGDYEHAEAQMQKALAVGVKDPKLLLHARAAELHLGHNAKEWLHLKDAASRHSREALRVLRDMLGKPGDGLE